MAFGRMGDLGRGFGRLGAPLGPPSNSGGLPEPPVGWFYLIDTDGAFLIDTDGAYLLTQ